jgi:hypothetical protein
MKATNKFVFNGFFLLLLAVALTALDGCAAKPSYHEAFSNSESVGDNNKIIPGSLDTTWNSALELVAQQGFNIDQMDSKGKVMSMTKELRNKEDQEVSHTIKSTATFIPLSEQQTRVILSANQTTELHKKEYVWWHLLWILPIIPIDTEYTTVVTDRDTIKSPEFYQNFFAKLLANVTAKNQAEAETKAVAAKEAAEIAAVKAAQAKAAAAAEAAAEKAADDEIAAKTAAYEAEKAAQQKLETKDTKKKKKKAK